MGRMTSMLAVALPLAAADLALKATMPTHEWAYHQRSLGWCLVCCVIFVGLLAVCRFPSALVPPTAGILAAGVLGNGLSAAFNGFLVPNPFLLERETEIIAFNLADVWAVLGIGSLGVVIAARLVRDRHRLGRPRPVEPSPADPLAEDGQTVF
jgi:hypothetical protein